jgi:ABC-type glycerol-3-phosphate transport system permease component
MLSTSLKSEAEALSLPIRWIPQQPTLGAYVEMWTLKPFGLYFWNSIMVSGVTAVLSTVVGALAGYGFSRFHFRGRTSLLAFFLSEGTCIEAFLFRYFAVSDLGSASSCATVPLNTTSPPCTPAPGPRSIT